MLHTCKGCDRMHPLERVWHGSYVRWYDARQDARPVVAAVWGWFADRVAFVVWDSWFRVKVPEHVRP